MVVGAGTGKNKESTRSSLLSSRKPDPCFARLVPTGLAACGIVDAGRVFTRSAFVGMKSIATVRQDHHTGVKVKLGRPLAAYLYKEAILVPGRPKKPGYLESPSMTSHSVAATRGSRGRHVVPFKRTTFFFSRPFDEANGSTCVDSPS